MKPHGVAQWSLTAFGLALHCTTGEFRGRLTWRPRRPD